MPSRSILTAVIVNTLVLAVVFAVDDIEQQAAFPKNAANQQPVVRQTDLYGDPLPPRAISRLGTVRFRHTRGVKAISFSRDGKQIIGLGENDSVPKNKALCVWDATTGRLIRTIDTGYQHPRGFDFLPKQALAATIGFYFDEKKREYHRNIKLLNVATGKQQASIQWQEPHGSECNTVAWVPDGTTLITGSTDGTLRVWDRSSGTELLSYKLPGRRSQIRSLDVSPDGKIVAIGADRSGVYLWNWIDGGEPAGIAVDARGAISVEFSPDGKRLAVGTDSGRASVYLIDVDERKVTKRLRSPNRRHNYVPALRFSPNGKLLVSTGYFANEVNVWDPASGELVCTIDVKPERPGCLAISPDSKLLAVSGSGGVVRLWDLATGREISGRPDSHLEGGIEVAFCEDRSIVATASRDGTVRLWDAQSGRQKLKVQHDHPPGGYPWVRALALSPDGRFIASGGAVDTTRLWDAKTGREIYRLPGHGRYGGRWKIAFSKDGTTFTTFGDDMRIRIWHVATGKCLEEYVVRPSGVDLPTDDEELEPSGQMQEWRFSIGQSRFSPDASKFFLQMSGSLYVFDVATGKELKKFQQPRIGSLAVSRDGKQVLMTVRGKPMKTKLASGTVRNSSAKNHSLILMDVSTGKKILNIDGIEGYPGPVAYSSDGRLIATAPRKWPGEIHIWSTMGEKRRRIKGFRGSVYSLVFSVDSGRIAGGMSDTTTLIWKIAESAAPPISQTGFRLNELARGWILPTFP